MRLSIPAFLTTALLLSACTLGGDEPSNENSQSSASQASSIQETQNVAYTGVVEPAGISIYQEGTHRLTLENGTFVLLESSVIDLNGYVDEEVQAFGSLRPTVEAGGKILHVSRIELLSVSSSSSSESSSEESSSSSSMSSSLSSAASSRSIASAVRSAASESMSESVNSDALQARAEIMASHDIASANWTQTYCTGHIGFCIPVHKNWWYTSFGTTTTYLWHVEINSEEIENLGDGPISVNLLAGSSPVPDGTIRTEGNLTVGYRSWTENRYFVIRADAVLDAAVRHITQNLESYDEEE